MTILTTGTRDDARAGEIAAIECPFERVKAINAIGRQNGTLPGVLAQLRLAALREGRRLTKTTTALAAKVDMKRSRVSCLLNTTTPHSQPAGTRPVTETPAIKESQQSC